MGEAFVRGILCNILVCIAVWMSFAAKRVSGKLLTSYWPVMLFVLCGFEHSIADMYFGVCGLLTAQVYGIAAESLSWFNFLVKALLPITLGNIVGGAGIVGCGYWLAYLHRTPYSSDLLPCKAHPSYINLKVSKEMLSNPRSPWQGIRNAARSRSVAERSGT